MGKKHQVQKICEVFFREYEENDQYLFIFSRNFHSLGEKGKIRILEHK